MEIFINGYSSIVKEIEKDSLNELNGYKKEIDQKKSNLEQEYSALFEKEKKRIDSVTKKVASANYKRSLAIAKVKLQDEFLEKKEVATLKILSAVKDKLESLSSSEKQDFLNKKIEEVIKNTDEKIVEIQVPKGVKVKLATDAKITDNLTELGFLLITNEGMIINHGYDVLLDQKEADLRKLIANSLL